jgi:hypothetical protein
LTAIGAGMRIMVTTGSLIASRVSWA